MYHNSVAILAQRLENMFSLLPSFALDEESDEPMPGLTSEVDSDDDTLPDFAGDTLVLADNADIDDEELRTFDAETLACGDYEELPTFDAEELACVDYEELPTFGA